MPVPAKYAANASLICSLYERQWRSEYGEQSPLQAQACLNGNQLPLWSKAAPQGDGGA
jgi:hypothetical protein